MIRGPSLSSFVDQLTFYIPCLSAPVPKITTHSELFFPFKFEKENSICQVILYLTLVYFFSSLPTRISTNAVKTTVQMITLFQLSPCCHHVVAGSLYQSNHFYSSRKKYDAEDEYCLQNIRHWFWVRK